MKKLWIVFIFIALGLQAQWTDNPAVSTVINATPGSKYVPKIAVTPDGNYFFSWYGGSGNLDMNMAHFDHSGVAIWPMGGSIKVSTHPQNSWVDDYSMTTDMEGNAIVVFSDIRDGSKSVVAYKVDGEGNQLWGDDGVFFSLPSSADYQPQVVVTPENDVYVFHSTGYSNGNDNKIILHKILADGSLPWGTSGKQFGGAFGVNWSFPVGKANDDGGITIGFFKETGNFPALQRELATFRCDADGELLWGATMVTDAGGISAWDDLMMHGNGTGGAYFLWHDDRYFNNTYEVYSQYVDGEGTAMWYPNGLLMAVEVSGHQIYEIPAGVNNSGEFVAFWNRLNSNQSAGSLVYQRVSPEGDLLETNAGKTILPISDRMQNGLYAEQVGDSTFFLYRYFLEGSSVNTSFNMLALDATGNQLWPGPVEMVNSPIDRSHADLSAFHTNQAVVCWSDNWLGSDRVMAQNIFVDGSLGSSPVAVEEVAIKNYQYFIGLNDRNKTLSLQNLEIGDELKIFNMQGSEVFSINAENQVVLNRYLKGMYIAVLVRDGKYLEQYKFVL